MSNTSSTPSRPHASRGRWAGGVILLLALAAGFALWQHQATGNTTATDYVTRKVVRADIEQTVTATGILQPRDYVDVGTQVSGVLKTLHVEIGDAVQAGQLLAEIDPTVYLSRVEAGRAQLAGQKAQLAERRARLVFAQRQFDRQQALSADDATSTEELQLAEADLETARAQIVAIEAQIQQTESELRGDEANLGYARIFAPMAGTVVSLEAKQGQTLNANQQTPLILRIADLSTMTVRAQVSEADVTRLRPYMEAYFTTLGNPRQRWHGRLERVLPTPTIVNNVVLYDALFDVANPDGRLLTSMTAQVFFVVASVEAALLVPLAALQPLAATAHERGNERRTTVGTPTASRYRVEVLDNHGRVTERDISVGVSNRIQAEVLDGLVEGEQVLLGAHATNGSPGSLRNTPKRGMRL